MASTTFKGPDFIPLNLELMKSYSVGNGPPPMLHDRSPCRKSWIHHHSDLPEFARGVAEVGESGHFPEGVKILDLFVANQGKISNF